MELYELIAAAIARGRQGLKEYIDIYNLVDWVSIGMVVWYSFMNSEVTKFQITPRPFH